MNKKINPFADPAFWEAWRESALLDAFPPRPFNVCVSKLPSGFAVSVTAALKAEQIEACLWAGRWWVNRSDLFDQMGPGAESEAIPFDACIDHDDIDRRRAALARMYPRLIR